MKIAPLPENEADRLKVLEKYDILDTDMEESYNHIVEVAAAVCQTPIALVCFIDKDRQWFKARFGLNAAQTSRDIAFCAHAILERGVFQVVDTKNDQRFSDNPLVTDSPNIRSYAGAPLITDDGFALGTLCVIDTKPKSFTSEQQSILEKLAKQVVYLLELRVASIKANESIKAKSTLLSNISHELRTPMSAILGFGQLIQHDTECPISDSQQENLDMIMQSSRHLLSLIDDLIDLSQLETNDSSVSITSLDPKLIIEESIKMMQPLSTKSLISINASNILNHPIKADRKRLKQVLLNLISNAIKYSKQNGTITVSNQITEDGYMRTYIGDNGIGIAEDNFDELFTLFSRLGQEETDIQGTGLGLPLTKGLVEAMKGRIGLDSTLGQGSLFWFDLPLAT